MRPRYLDWVHADPAKPHAGQAGWILSARALRWAMVAVDCSLARSHRQIGFFVVLGFVRFVSESRPASRRYPYRVLRERGPLGGFAFIDI
jgi:hypothetical protein